MNHRELEYLFLLLQFEQHFFCVETGGIGTGTYSSHAYPPHTTLEYNPYIQVLCAVGEEQNRYLHPARSLLMTYIKLGTCLWTYLKDVSSDFASLLLEVGWPI